jgi:hypothetical protein
VAHHLSGEWTWPDDGPWSVKVTAHKTGYRHQCHSGRAKDTAGKYRAAAWYKSNFDPHTHIEVIYTRLWGEPNPFLP